MSNEPVAQSRGCEKQISWLRKKKSVNRWQIESFVGNTAVSICQLNFQCGKMLVVQLEIVVFSKHNSVFPLSLHFRFCPAFGINLRDLREKCSTHILDHLLLRPDRRWRDGPALLLGEDLFKNAMSTRPLRIFTEFYLRNTRWSISTYHPFTAAL